MAEIENEISFVGDKQQALIYRANNSVIDVSCYINQSHSMSLTPTKNPVEEGIDITDHVKREPTTLNLKGITSNHQISLTETINAFKTLINNDDKKAAAPANDTFVAFKELYTNKELVTIYTNYETYKNMIMTNFSTSENKDNTESIEFDAAFLEIRIETNTQAEGENLAGKYANVSANAEKRAQAAKKAAKKAKKTAAVADKVSNETPKSWLIQIIEWLAG